MYVMDAQWNDLFHRIRSCELLHTGGPSNDISTWVWRMAKTAGFAAAATLVKRDYRNSSVKNKVIRTTVVFSLTYKRTSMVHAMIILHDPAEK